MVRSPRPQCSLTIRISTDIIQQSGAFASVLVSGAVSGLDVNRHQRHFLLMHVTTYMIASSGSAISARAAWAVD